MSPERARLQKMIEEINVELRKARPLVNAGIEATQRVQKRDIDEIKAYVNPPLAIMNVM